jgi:hypothetical protein
LGKVDGRRVRGVAKNGKKEFQIIPEYATADFRCFNGKPLFVGKNEVKKALCFLVSGFN